MASAACHSAGSVIGAAGHNASMRAIRDLGKYTDLMEANYSKDVNAIWLMLFFPQPTSEAKGA